jgi:hypothetical protein
LNYQEMAREKIKPFSRTEMKILIFNKVKKGMSYEDAKKEVEKEVNLCIKNIRDQRKKDQENTKNKTFKESFDILTHASQR